MKTLLGRIRPQILGVVVALGVGILICAQIEFSEGIVGCITGLSGIAGSLIESEMRG